MKSGKGKETVSKRQCSTDVHDDEFRTPTVSRGHGQQAHDNCVEVAINNRGVFVHNTDGRQHGFIGPTLCACGAMIPPGEDICPVGQVQI
ncbi:hypothetical protein HZA87_05010 [Candidatus Uhrbacteria bacterium]|nr:hypothetical protein [Candidatus Uhrbacteria bacterium]